MGAERFKLGDLCFKITDGSHNPPKGIDYSEHLMLSSKNVFDDHIHLEKPRYLSEIDFSKENKRTDVSAGDVLLTIVGTVGRVAVVGKSLPKFTLQRSVAVLKPVPDKILSRFLMYCLQSMLEELLGEARGVAQKGIYLKSLRAMEINTPPIPEQKRIVAILDQAFAGIEQARTKTEQNLKKARELFESYLQQVFSQRGKKVQSVELGDVVDVLTDYHANGSYKVLKQHVELKEQEDFAWMVRSTDFEKKFKNEKRYITEHAYNYLTKSKLFGGEIIMSKIGNAGKVYFMPETDRPCSLAMNLFLIRLDPSKANNEYIYRYLNSSSGKAQIAPRLKGAATQTITKDNVRSLQIPMPSLDGQHEVIKNLKILEKEIESLESLYIKKLINIEELKNSILHKAFTGELTERKEGAMA